MNDNCLSLYDFSTLMLIHLAKNSQNSSIGSQQISYASIPFSYKEIIQNILYTDNRWKEMFSVLIDVEKYFNNHFSWEEEMAYALNNVIKSLGKTIEVDFLSDKFKIAFTTEELDNLMKQYPDDNINHLMNHFTRLLNEHIFTRQYIENMDDKSNKAR